MYRYADRSLSALARLYLKYFRRIKEDDEDLLELLIVLQGVYRDAYKSLRDAMYLTARATYKRVSTDLQKRLAALSDDEASRLLMDVMRRLQNASDFEEDDEIDMYFVDSLLNNPDPLLKYAIRPEFDRRRQRLYEGLTVSENRRKDADKASAELLRIAAQALDNATDAANKRALEKSGVKYVKWNAILDLRTCAECRALNGTIFPIEDVPNKPHPRCRCYLEPVLKVEELNDD